MNFGSRGTLVVKGVWRNEESRSDQIESQKAEFVVVVLVVTLSIPKYYFRISKTFNFRYEGVGIEMHWIHD